MQNIKILSADDPAALISGDVFKRNPYGYIIGCFSAALIIPIFLYMAHEASQMGKDATIIYVITIIIALIPIFMFKRALSLLNTKAWVLNINDDSIAINLRNNNFNSFLKTSNEGNIVVIPKSSIISITPVNYRNILATEKIQLSMINCLELKFSDQDYTILEKEINEEATYIAGLGGDLECLNANVCYKSLKADKNTIRIPFMKLFLRKKLFNTLKQYNYPLVSPEARQLSASDWAKVLWEWHVQHKKT